MEERLVAPKVKDGPAFLMLPGSGEVLPPENTGQAFFSFTRIGHGLGGEENRIENHHHTIDGVRVVISRKHARIIEGKCFQLLIKGDVFGEMTARQQIAHQIGHRRVDIDLALLIGDTGIQNTIPFTTHRQRCRLRLVERLSGHRLREDNLKIFQIINQIPRIFTGSPEITFAAVVGVKKMADGMIPRTSCGETSLVICQSFGCTRLLQSHGSKKRGTDRCESSQYQYHHQQCHSRLLFIQTQFLNHGSLPSNQRRYCAISERCARPHLRFQNGSREKAAEDRHPLLRRHSPTPLANPRDDS